MSYVLYIIGIAIVLSVVVDIIWTTFWIDGGAGWLSDRLTTAVWRMILKTGNKFLLNISGSLIMTVILFGWVLLLWLGVTIFFAGNLDAIVNTSTSETITWYQLPYYTGFTLFTLGIGDYTPQTPFFQIATALSSGLGMLMLTFGASYIISVVSAVVQKRTFARNVMGIGENSVEFIENIWNGEDFHQLDDFLSDLNSDITQLTQQIQAFPLLQYYHSEEKEKTTTVAMAVLYETLTILKYALKDNKTVNMALVNAALNSINTYIDTASDGYGNLFEDFDETPSEIDLAKLSDTSIPLTTQEEYSRNIQTLENDRQQLLKIIKIDNHEWPN